ncbi:GTP-binding protein Rheb [Ailuropoda melanoleuca]|uniref:GTP-binding protein Rheb n=1 Tax=Ailuropoda melanoleuca TaxID=9646 RepID=UPI001494BC8F|nr:GTP-binding protein Rheb [Ailuropoda melanoleuca]
MLETTTEDRERDRSSADEAAAGLGRTDSNSEGSSTAGKMPSGSTGRGRETVTDKPSRRRTARLSYEPARPRRRPPAPSTLMATTKGKKIKRDGSFPGWKGPKHILISQAWLPPSFSVTEASSAGIPSPTPTLVLFTTTTGKRGCPVYFLWEKQRRPLSGGVSPHRRASPADLNPPCKYSSGPFSASDGWCLTLPTELATQVLTERKQHLGFFLSVAKFSVLKKTRDLKDVWLRRASFLLKKPERALFESPLDVASDRRKSSLTIQFVEGQFVDSYDPTIENTFTKLITVNGQEYHLQLVDTAGQDEYSIFPQTYSIDINGYILVYSVTSIKSFEVIKVIHGKLLDMVGKVQIPIMLVGNKKDLHMERVISYEEGKALAESWNAAFLESSAKENQTAVDVFRRIILEAEKIDGAASQGKSSCSVM